MIKVASFVSWCLRELLRGCKWQRVELLKAQVSMAADEMPLSLCVLSSLNRQDEAEPIFQAGDGSVASRTFALTRTRVWFPEPIGQLRTICNCNSSSRGLFWPRGVRHAHGTHIYTQAERPTQNVKQVILTKPDQSLRKRSYFPYTP